ncbi:MAG: hypothetical protein P4L53_18745 [Candidatus Obscuribacterales bacterium]|nr:hypothetical protein [Candidatus Obscuribacterales bacterium]
MIKIADAVREVLFSSEIAHSALCNGFLNLSSYALSIQKEIEQRTKKSVRPGTIVVALSRLSKTIDTQAPLTPVVDVKDLAVKTRLVELTFDKTKINREKLQRLYIDQDFATADFLTVTYGVGELSIVVPESLKKSVLKLYGKQKPKLIFDNLASLTLRIGEDCINTPNVTFALVRMLALRRINIVEIVSTFTELTFILHQNDLNEAIATMLASMPIQEKSKHNHK